jgi:uncharacterized protein
MSEFMNVTAIDDLTQSFRKYGFSSITLDLEGFRSGKLNDAIAKAKQPNVVAIHELPLP